jgi:integrase
MIHHGGRRKKKRIGRDRETAERVARAVREKLLRGDLDLEPATDEQTLKAYAATWLTTMAGTLKASTADFYDAHLRRHILPALGTRPVSSLRRADCRDLVASCRAKGLAATTVRGIARTLSNDPDAGRR